MSGKRPYSYVILRYVHDVMTGEFVNVGVLLLDHDRGQIMTKTQTKIGRIKGTFPDVNREVFVSAMKRIERGARKLSKETQGLGFLVSVTDVTEQAYKLLPRDDSSLQWSSVGSRLALDAEHALDQIYSRFVDRYDAKGAHRRSDEAVWRPVKAMLDERKIHIDLQEKVVVGKTDSIAFKKAWKNGQWHAYEPLSFDLADADNIKDKARRWRGHLTAVADGTSENVRVHFVLGAPQDLDLTTAYHNAVEILRGSPFDPEIFEEANIEDLVSEIEDEVRAHEAAKHLPKS